MKHHFKVFSRKLTVVRDWVNEEMNTSSSSVVRVMYMYLTDFLLVVLAETTDMLIELKKFIGFVLKGASLLDASWGESRHKLLIWIFMAIRLIVD